LTVLPRVGLVFAHLMLCVFALHCVLSTDWKLLRAIISAQQLQQAHRRVLWLLGGLWATGLLLIAIDTGFDLTQIQTRPKLVAKLVCVLLLTVNGLLLRGWCFPRLVSERPLGRVEAMALMVCGAVSSASWLMAAFFGIARPLQGWDSALACLGLYWLALGLAVAVALPLQGRLREGRMQRAEGGTPHAAGTATAAAAADNDGPLVNVEQAPAH
jgi:hypothetical protein